MKQGFLIHYGEIGLKGKNRPFFEKKLVQNVNSALADLKQQNRVRPLKRLYGRLFLEIPAEEINNNFRRSEFISESDEESKKILKQVQDDKSNETISLESQIKNRLRKVFGIANFSEAFLVDRDPHTLKHAVWNTVQRQQPFSTFRIRASRADKSFPLTSRDVEFQIGGFVKAKSKAKVNLERAELTCFIEILSKEALFYFNKISGPGGLPVSTAGKAVALLSGGIDSPAAAWRIARRGAKNIFVHFHSYPQTDKASQENVRDLVRKLTEWQLSSKLYLVPLLNIQKKIVARCPTKLRVVLYRRTMLRIAEKIARKEKSKALVTGESLGQVASQTLENIDAINRVTTLPVLRPLIGMDKEEIINLAKKISTYEISIRPYEDCCSLFVPEHPETKAKLAEVEEAEKKLDIEKLTRDALENTTTEIFKFLT